MPEGAIYVGRPTIWGNPWVVGDKDTAQECVNEYRHYIIKKLKEDWISLDDLRGHDLACWCPLDQPCHADVLIELLELVR